MTTRFRAAAVGVVVLLLAAALFLLIRGTRSGGPQSQTHPPSSAPGPAPDLRPGGELVAAIRQDPPSFNRYGGRGNDNTVEVISQLTDGKLVRVDRTTGELQPWLAERWVESPDHLTYTLTLRDSLKWSDGVAFSPADVLFSFRALYDERLKSPLRSSMLIAGRPIAVSSPDARTIVLRMPTPFGPGLSILENLPMLPRHKLEAFLHAGTMAEAWGPSTPPSEMVSLGPFRITGYTPAQQVMLERNPHYWRKIGDVQLPYLDRLTLSIVRDLNTEVLRIEHGQIDISAREIRPEDYSALRRLAEEKKVQLADAGIGLDPNMLWFNLAPEAYARDPRKAWLQSEDFRKAISHAIDRQAVVDQVYLGLAAPVYGPVTPGAAQWYVEGTPRYEYDPSRARAIFSERLGFADRDGNGTLEDRDGRPVRFAILTQQQDTIRTRTASVIQAQLKRAGITVDVAGLDTGALVQRFYAGTYDAIYFGVEATSTDPANNLDFWLSSGSFHVWNPGQKAPGTEWEKQLDDLAYRQAGTTDQTERRRLYAEMQRILGEHIPVIYLAAPRLIVALSPRVANARPAPLKPLVLWSADTLAHHRPQSTDRSDQF